MGRLTARGNRGYASLKGTSCRYSHVSYDCQIEEGRSKLEEALEKLASYEDIIDEPEKLKLIDELYLERCEEINRLKVELAEARNKAIEELAVEIKATLPITVSRDCSEIDYEVDCALYSVRNRIDRIAKQMKEV